MYKTLHKKQGSVTVQLRFARSSVTFCAKRDMRDEKVLKVVLKKCIESKSDIKPMANGKSLDMLTDKIMELVKDVYL